MFCAEPIGLMDQETQYLSVLQTAATYVEEAGQLTLLDGAGNPVAVFVAAG
jgi:heat shock protein HslJ